MNESPTISAMTHQSFPLAAPPNISPHALPPPTASAADALTRQERIRERAAKREHRASIRAQRAAERRGNRALDTLPLAEHPSGDWRPIVPQPETPFEDIDGRPLYLSSLYRGCSLFLILSGPSLSSLDLSLLDRRGVITMAVNNAATIRRAHLWTCVDPVRKFHDAIWLDPQTIKIIPKNFLNTPLRTKLPDGAFARMSVRSPGGEVVVATPRDMPAVIACRRNPNFNPPTWLSEPSINWGNSKRSAIKNGAPRTLNVMFASLKTAYALGFRHVYLLGCDFHMSFEQPYAFAQGKHDHGAVASNNNAYRNLNQMLGMLKPSFNAAAFSVYNCYQSSGLTVFPYVSFENAIAAATGHIPQDPLDAKNWYG